jgi:predicted membrane metal-binding protein
MIRHFDRYGPNGAEWLKAVILGQLPGPHRGWLTGFKDTGLVHFLVVSGAHVVLVSKVSRVLVALPLWWLHLTGLLSARRFAGYLGGVKLIALLPVIVFSLVCGLDPPVQRALIALALISVPGFGGFQLHWATRLLLVLAVQAAIWPVGFFSATNGMSWLASTVVLLTHRVGSVWRQWLMFVSFSLLAGAGSAAGLLANLILLPALEVFFLASILVATVGPDLAGWARFESAIGFTWKAVRYAGWHLSGPLFAVSERPSHSLHLRAAMTVIMLVVVAHFASTRLASKPAVPSDSSGRS